MVTKRVFALYRVSTLKQVEKDDIPMQQQACKAFCQRMGWTMIREYKEKGVSGYKKSAQERDAIKDLRAAAERKEFDILLVFMFDRIGRREDETPFVVKWFVEHGIEVWSAQEGQQKFDTRADSLINFMRYWMAEGESEKTSIRTKTRLGQLTAEGIYTGGGKPFGYDLIHKGRVNRRNKPVYDLVINQDEAEIVRLIFRKYVYEGMGAQAISHWLTDQHITKKDGRGFPNTSINRMIKNVLYTGVIKNGDTSSQQMAELQIIDQETFEQAQRIMKARTQSRGEVPLNIRGDSLLAGKVYCGHCGGVLCLTTSGRRRRKSDGTLAPARVRYSCFYKVRHKNECDGQSGYSRDKLDHMVDQIIRLTFQEIKAISKGELLSAQSKRQQAALQVTIKQLTAQIQAKQREQEDLKRETIRVIRGESKLTDELLGELIESNRIQLQEMEDAVQAKEDELRKITEGNQALEAEYNRIMSWADLYDQCPIGTKKMIISTLIQSVRVFRDYKLQIKFNISFWELKRYKERNDQAG